MNQKIFRRLIAVLYAVIAVALSVLFFTNDFGLVDLRKTSVIIGVGLDIEGDDLVLTVQLALPQPAENGETTQFSTVTGRGKTVACALNEVNVKTGFYPKLVFCRLVLLGESCFSRDANTLLNYFFDNEYTGLTPKVAACKGSAADMLSLNLPYGDSTTDFIERILSEEAQKSGNVSAINLNQFGQAYYKKSKTSYMPYIEMVQSAGEEQGRQQADEASGGEGEGQPIEFLCNRTAVFLGGVCKGVLEKEQAFAFNLLNSRVRHAYTQCGQEGERNVLGLRNCKGDINLEIEGGKPILKLSFKATAKLMDGVHDRNGKVRVDSHTPEEALEEGERAIERLFKELFEENRRWGCDIFGARDLLYKKHYRHYASLKDGLYETIILHCDVQLKSVS